MPHYFIDTHDGERHLRDEDGIDLPGSWWACNEAIRILPGIARDLLSDGDPLQYGKLPATTRTVKDGLYADRMAAHGVPVPDADDRAAVDDALQDDAVWNRTV